MSQVNITLNTNTVDVNTTNNQIVVTDPTNPNVVNITQPVTSVVEVITAGPQGAPGPAGAIPNTGSFATTGSNQFNGNQTITGSLNVVQGSNPILNTGTSILYRNGTASVDWRTRTLNNSDGNVVVDWDNNQVYDILGSSSIDWEGRTLYDPNDLLSVDYGARRLRNSGNNLILNWETGNLTGTASYASQALSSSFASTASFLGSTTNAFLQNGNSFGTTALLGTNDNQSLALETSGSTRMFISSSGNVGIGTTTPGNLLSVAGAVSATVFNANSVVLTTRNSKADLYGFTGPTLSYYNGAAIVPALTVIDTGNVGIGTTTPTAKLSIFDTSGGSAANKDVLIVNNSGGAALQSTSIVFTNTPNSGKASITSYLMAGGAGADLNFNTSTTGGTLVNRMSITSTGNVGIGTTSSLSQLEVRGSDTSFVKTNLGAVDVGYNTSNRVGLTQNIVGYSSAMGPNGVGGIRIGDGSTYAYLSANGTSLLLNGGGGNVGIGTLTPSASLHIVGATSSSLSSSLIVQNLNRSSSLVVLNNGFVGIGTASPTVALDVVGSEYRFAATSGAINFYALPGVNQHFNFINSRQDSDYLFKQNVNGAANTNVLILKGLTGNVLVNTATDSGHKLLVTGSGTSGSLNVDGTLYVSGSSVGIGTSTPSASLDVSGSARINGVLTVGGNIVPSAGGTYNVGSAPIPFSNGIFINTVYSNQFASYNSHLYFANSGVNFARITNTTGNFIIQNGGTYTDAGYRLDVSGSTRVTNGLTVTGSTVLTNGQTTVRGSGTTSGTTAFLVQNSTPTTLFSITDNGNAKIGNNAYNDPASNLIVGVVNGANAARLAVANSSSYQDAMLVNTGISSGNINNWSFGQRWDTFFGNATGSFQIVGGYVSNTGVTSTVGGGYRVPLICNPDGTVIIAGASANAINSNVLLGTTTNTGHKLLVTGSGASGSLNVDGTLYVSGSSVGIGTSTPSDKLSISAGNILLDSGRRLKWADGSFIEGAGASSIMTFRSLGNYYFNGGNLGIGLAAPSASLHISGASSANLLRIDSPASSSILFVSGSGNVGIGTSTPAFPLDVNGTARIQNTIQATGFLINASTLVGMTNLATALCFKTNDNGANIIGNSAPYFSFDNNGTVINRTSGTGRWFNVVQNASFAPTSGTCTMDWMTVAPTINQTGGANGITRGLYIAPTLTAAADFRAVENTVGNNLLNSTSGNTYVGLSTNTGTARLQVRGSGATSATTTFLVQNSTPSTLFSILDNGNVTVSGSNFDLFNNAGAYSGFTLNSNASSTMYVGAQSAIAQIKTEAGGNAWIGAYQPGMITRLGYSGSAGGATYINFSTNGANSGLHVTHNGGSDLMTVTSAGNVGIGHPVPSASLHISGASSANLLRIDSPASSSILFVSGSGRVGIGTSAPLAPLDILVSRSASTQIAAFRTTATSGHISLYNFTDPQEIARIESSNDISNGGSLRLYTRNGSNVVGEKMRITGTGEVGIGTTTPTGKLSITDTIIASGSASSGSLLDLSQTWNTTGNPTTLLLNVTNTASGVSSNLIDLQVGGASRVRIDKNGTIWFGSNNLALFAATGGSPAVNGQTLFLQSSRTPTNGGDNYFFLPTLANNNTSGTANGINNQTSFTPSSGTGIYNAYNFSSTINQTGGANGITRGLYIAPTLTAAADFRAIETTVGNNLLNSTSGNTYVGLSTNTGTARLQVRGSGATNATTALLVQNSTPTNLLSINDIGQVSFTSPTMSLAVSQSAFSISPIISASAVVGGQYYGVNITPTFFQTTGSQTETAFRVAATFTSSNATATQGTNIIADFGSTSAGSQLTVTDVTSGSIYMVNDVSGLPIIEATSDWGVKIYDFPRVVLEKTGSQVNINGTLQVSGSFILPLSQSATPQTGSAYWSGSLLFIYNGTRYMSASFA